jgi:hypothetical protein
MWKIQLSGGRTRASALYQPCFGEQLFGHRAFILFLHCDTLLMRSSFCSFIFRWQNSMKKSQVSLAVFLSSNNIKRIVISIWIRKICNLWWAWSVVVHFALLSFPWWAYRLHPGMWSRYQYLSCMIQCVVPFLKLRVLFIAVIYNLWLIICNQDWLLACYMR